MLISGLETSNVEAGELENIKSQRLARAGRLFRYSQQISEMGGPHCPPNTQISCPGTPQHVQAIDTTV
jgi:hypothetical protein